MRKSLVLAIVAALMGGWGFFQKFELAGLDRIQIRSKDSAEPLGHVAAGGGPANAMPPVARDGQTIRIASFNIQVFGQSKIGKSHVVARLVDVVRRFDVIAIQEIRSKDQTVMQRFVDQVNAAGRQYDYVIGQRQGRTSSKEQYAFVFDTQSVEIDPSSVYDVSDPHDQLHRPPLVASFRVRGPPVEQAFTFTLINVHTDPDEVDTEVDALALVYRGVRDDGRGEDDIILLGDLNADDRHLGELGEISDITCLITGVPTNTRGSQLYDNVLIHRRATVEFTNRAGVFDLMRQFNITLDEALEISDHLPIWGEFSIYEGGQAPRVAERVSEGM